MRQVLTALLVGILLGGGLALSDMVNPARVLAFLDVAGSWDPTLAFVMAGAILPAAFAFAWSNRLARPLFNQRFASPANRTLDWRLMVGGALFGVGWGLAGFCPGPALSGLVFGLWQNWLFIGAMFAGMVGHRAFETLSERKTRPNATATV